MIAGVLLMTTHIAASPALAVTSTAFKDGADIPQQFTCEGADDSQPWPIAIANVPANAKSLAVVIHDPDAPDPKAPRPQGWTHFVAYNLAPSTTSLPAKGNDGAAGKNDWGKSGFKGPCPPTGKHRYVTTVFALDQMLPDLKQPDRAALLKAVEGHVVAKGELTGAYQKKK
jgi:Raf kinase inhibitor-like YbhB/YbcL family protein